MDESQNPYRGLQSFESEHSNLFFGRQPLTEKLYEIVAKQTLTVVLGASGSGKSSLVKAGLIPYIRQLQTQSNQQQWQILATMRPGESPLKALNNTLTSASLAVGSISSLTTNEKAETLAANLALWSQQNSNSKLLLVIDQFEELITLCQDDQERQNFLNLLAQEIAKYPEQLRLVLTLRSDFEPQFQGTVLKRYWNAARFAIPLMTRSELREAIEEPASAKVMYFQSNDPNQPLVEQLIDEVANMPGGLPLLSFTLSELYLKYLKRQRIGQQRGETIDRAITEADYKELGGVARSLTQRADNEYEELVKQDQAYEQIICNVMLRMIAVGGELARRRVPLSELEYPPSQNERVKEVIRRFADARLLVEGQDTEGNLYVEPAHDALVRGWQKLLKWKQEYNQDLILQRRLTPAAFEWKSLKSKEQSSGFQTQVETVVDWLDKRLYVAENLLKKINARLAQRWWQRQNQQEGSREKPVQFLWNANPYINVLNKELNSNENWFNQVETEFVQQSVLQKRRNISWAWCIAIAVILGLSGLTIWALFGQRNAQIGQIRASRQSSEANLRSNQELDALLDSLQAGKSLKQPLLQLVKPDNQIQNQLQETLQKAVYQVKERNRLKGDRDNVSSVRVSFSPDGQLLATYEDNGTIHLWNLQGQPLKEWKADSSTTMSFSPDGQQLATAGGTGIVRLWNLQGQLLKEWKADRDWLDPVSFSPNGQLLVVCGIKLAPLFRLSVPSPYMST